MVKARVVLCLDESFRWSPRVEIVTCFEVTDTYYTPQALEFAEEYGRKASKMADDEQWDRCEEHKGEAHHPPHWCDACSVKAADTHAAAAHWFKCNPLPRPLIIG